MNLKDVMQEIAEKLSMHTGLNVYDYPTDTVTPPAGVIGYPETITYDETYDGGEMMFNKLPIWMVSDRIDSKSARNQVSAWTAPIGNKSVKQFLDKENYNSCDSVHVGEAQFDVTTIADVPYLVALFEVTVTGPQGE